MPSEKKKFLIIEKKVSIWTKVGLWYEKECGGELFTIYIFRALGDPRFSLVFQFPLRIERVGGEVHSISALISSWNFFINQNLLHTVLCSKSLVYKIV